MVGWGVYVAVARPVEFGERQISCLAASLRSVPGCRLGRAILGLALCLVSGFTIAAPRSSLADQAGDGPRLVAAAPQDLDTLPRARRLWRVAGTSNSSESLFASGQLVVMQRWIDSILHLQALHLGNGSVVWSWPLQEGGEVLGLRGESLLVMGNDRAEVRAIATGKGRWAATCIDAHWDESGRQEAWLRVHGGAEVRDGATGKRLWKGRLGQKPSWHKGVVAAGWPNCGLKYGEGGALVPTADRSGCPLALAPGAMMPASVGDAEPGAQDEPVVPACPWSAERAGVYLGHDATPSNVSGCQLDASGKRVLLTVHTGFDQLLLWLVDVPTGEARAVLLPVEQAQTVSWLGDKLAVRLQDAVEVFEVTATDPPRRASVALQTDIASWLKALQRQPSADSDCQDTAPREAELAVERLQAVWSPEVEAALLPVLRSADAQLLARLAPLACSRELKSAAAATAWLLRLHEVLAREPAQSWVPLLELADTCSGAAPAVDPWSALLRTLLRQPVSDPWMVVRTQVVQRIHQPLPADLADPWGAAVISSLRRERSLPAGGQRPELPAVELLVASLDALARWPGRDAALQRWDEELRQRGPAALCPRDASGACAREPGKDAWSSGADGWTLEMNASLGSADLWAWRWAGDVWQGPYFAARAEWVESNWGHGEAVPHPWGEFKPELAGALILWRPAEDEGPCEPGTLPPPPRTLPPPLDPSTFSRDSDGDGWTDLLERRVGTDPRLADSDGDGVADSRDAAPRCPRAARGANWTVLAWVGRLRLSPTPLRTDGAAPCADVPTLGGPWLDVADLGLEAAASWPLGPQLWQAELQIGSRSWTLVAAPQGPLMESVTAQRARRGRL